MPAETTAPVADAAKAEAKAPEAAKKPVSKEELYRSISTSMNAKVDEYFAPVAARVKDKAKMEIKMRQVFGDQDARDLVVAVFDGLFDILLTPGEDGSVKPVSLGIPGGFGSIQLTTAGATTKKTPQGQTVEVQKRWRVKYSPGKSVDERLKQLPAPAEDAGDPEDAKDE